MNSGTSNNRMFQVIGVALAAIAFFAFATLAHANPFFTGTKAQSGTASSTQTYLRGGVATSTTIYDSYEQSGTNQTNSGNLTIPNAVAVVLDGVASSTASVLSLTCEYSDNFNASSGNGDWYQNDIFPSNYATSSNPTNIAAPASYSFNYASSTVGGAGLSGSNTRFQKITTCPVITRYLRVIVSNTGPGASVWVQIIPLKQRNSGN